MSRNTLNTLKDFPLSAGQSGQFYSLPALGESLGVNLSRLPVSIRIVLESVLRNCDGKKVTEEHVRQVANWGATAERTDEIPFVVARVVLQDFTGVPLLADLAAMRNVANKMGVDAKKIEPLVPVDLVVDHSVTIDHFREPNALDLNMKLEFSAQQRALPVHEVGHASLRHLRRRASGLRHRPPGQPGIPGARRHAPGRHLLP